MHMRLLTFGNVKAPGLNPYSSSTCFSGDNCYHVKYWIFKIHKGAIIYPHKAHFVPCDSHPTSLSNRCLLSLHV